MFKDGCVCTLTSPTYFNRFAEPLEVVTLDKLQLWVRTGRLDGTCQITMKQLYDSGLVTSIKHGVKILRGVCESETNVCVCVWRGPVVILCIVVQQGPLTIPLHLLVTQASQGAIAEIDAAGGTVITRYYSPLALRALLKPEKFTTIPKSPLPPPKKIGYYTSDENRGYLSRLVGQFVTQ